MKRRSKVTLPDGSTGCQDIDLRKRLNLSYLRYTNMLGRRYVDLLPPRHPKRTTCPTASWTCRRSRSALFHYAFNPIDERVVAYRPIRNTYMTLRKAAWSGLKPMPDILRYVPSRAAPVLLLPSKNGWSDMMPKAYLHALSIALGYRLAPPKVWSGCANAESRSPSSRKPSSPPNRSIADAWIARTSSLEKARTLTWQALRTHLRTRP